MQAEASFLDEDVSPPTYAVLARVSPGYPPLPGRLPTCYSPVRRSPETEASFAHDLHVLSTPPAFILSQDQTLQFRPLRHLSRANRPGGSHSDSTSALKDLPQRTGPSGSLAADFSLFLYLVFKEPAFGPRRFSGEAKSRAGWFTCQPPASDSLPSGVGTGEVPRGCKRTQPPSLVVYSRPDESKRSRRPSTLQGSVRSRLRASG